MVKKNARPRLIALLEEGPKTQAQLALALDVDCSLVSRTLSDLRECGVVEFHGFAPKVGNGPGTRRVLWRMKAAA